MKKIILQGMMHGFYWRPQSSKCGHTQKRSNRQEFLPIEKKLAEKLHKLH